MARHAPAAGPFWRRVPWLAGREPRQDEQMCQPSFPVLDALPSRTSGHHATHLFERRAFSPPGPLCVGRPGPTPMIVVWNLDHQWRRGIEAMDGVPCGPRASCRLRSRAVLRGPPARVVGPSNVTV